MSSATSDKAEVRVYGGPTTLIEYGGLRFVADPTFDPPGEYPMPLPGDHKLVKTAPSPVTAADLGPVDAVLLSHDEHDDNLDNAGRAFLSGTPVVFTTVSGAGRLGGNAHGLAGGESAARGRPDRGPVPAVLLSPDEHADNLDNAGRAFLSGTPVVFTTVSGAGRLGGNAHGLAVWESADLWRPDGGTVTVTGVPARHGPVGCEPVTGDVVGFMLTSHDLASVYVSGDNAALELVEEIAGRFAPVDTAVLFLGGARMPFAFDNALLTLDSAQGAEAAKILGARRVVPAHFDSWAHFKEGRSEIEAAFAEAGLTDRLDFAR